MKLKSYNLIILVIVILLVVLWFWWEYRLDNPYFDNTPKEQIKVSTNVTYANKEESELLESIKSSFGYQAELIPDNPTISYLVSGISDIDSDPAKIENLALACINRIILKEDRIIGKGISAHAELEYLSDRRVVKYTIKIATLCRRNGSQGLGYYAVLKKTGDDWILTDITHRPFSYSSFMDY